MATNALPCGQQRIVLAFLCNGPKSMDAIKRELYGARLDGGPEWSRNIVAITIMRLRRSLAPHGILILTLRDGHDCSYMVDPDHVEKVHQLLAQHREAVLARARASALTGMEAVV